MLRVLRSQATIICNECGPEEEEEEEAGSGTVKVSNQRRGSDNVESILYPVVTWS